MSTLINKIKEKAPLRLDQFIEMSLFDENDGYYQTKPAIGSQGDFITAPEISQIFGEVIGIWLQEAWQGMGAPNEFILLELGAGRGTLFQDIWQSSKRNQEFQHAAIPIIYEKSSKMRALQIANIRTDITFLDALSALPHKPLLVYSNEFYDALPIRQFRNEDGLNWEAFIDENFRKIWRPAQNIPFEERLNAFEIYEYNPLGVKIAQTLNQHIESFGGAQLIVDYGEWDGKGDSLQAIKSHKFSEILSEPGKADISAHIRFKDLASQNIKTQFTTQGAFLNEMGAGLRAQQLIKANQAQAEQITKAYQRLTHKDDMGELFKVMAIGEVSSIGFSQAPNNTTAKGEHNDE